MGLRVNQKLEMDPLHYAFGDEYRQKHISGILCRIRLPNKIVHEGAAALFFNEPSSMEFDDMRDVDLYI